MLLNVIAREGDPFESMRRLLRDNHEDPRQQVRLVRRAVAQYRSLLAAGVVERVHPVGEDGRTVRLVEDLHLGFALNQPLSTYALATFDVLDPEAPTYALDVVSVVEATLEDPRAVLGAQEFKARGEAVAEMKADGIDYDERMDLLEDVSWPKPLEELLEHTYEVYRRSHPWVAESALSPKSVVRDMYERAMTFAEYVAFYGLARSEGLVLRYLGDAYRTLRQTVPEGVRSPEVDDIIEWLGAVVRQTDSSLLDEWEQLSDPTRRPTEDIAPPTPENITANERAFTVLVRNAMFRRVELLARRRWDELAALDAETGGSMAADDWSAVGEEYFRQHDSLDTGPDARGPRRLVLDKEPAVWRVQQILGDPDGDHDWRIVAAVDLAASDAAGELVLDGTDLVQL
jgi:hypothetical protein